MSNVFESLQLQRIAEAIENGLAGGGSLTVDVTGAGDMQGASAGTAGVHGLVPAPAAGDESKVLTGAGTWEDPPASGGGGHPDYGNVITSGSYNLFDGFSYTAAEDCFVVIMVGCSTPASYPAIKINNTSIGYIWSQTSGVEFPLFIPLKTGDMLDISATNQGNNWPETYTVFGI